MRQIFGVEFRQLSKNDKEEIERYIHKCIRRETTDKPFLTPIREIGQRLYQRIKPFPEDNVRLGFQFSPDETDIIMNEVIDISAGGAKCFYAGPHTIKEDYELKHVVIFLPNIAIKCGGKVIYVLKGERRIADYYYQTTNLQGNRRVP